MLQNKSSDQRHWYDATHLETLTGKRKDGLLASVYIMY